MAAWPSGTSNELGNRNRASRAAFITEAEAEGSGGSPNPGRDSEPVVFGEGGLNLTEPIRRAAAAYPDDIALVDGDRKYSYRSFWSLVSRAAVRIREWGLKPKERMVLWVPNGARHLAAQFGAQ